jgi:hypothetical protein
MMKVCVKPIPFSRFCISVDKMTDKSAGCPVSDLPKISGKYMEIVAFFPPIFSGTLKKVIHSHTLGSFANGLPPPFILR